ncbi:MAG: hypothetical protein KDC38_11010 [Planctomycetes bacterium]|nr:hypothetical protein [Planctomycetota bacterium]
MTAMPIEELTSGDVLELVLEELTTLRLRELAESLELPPIREREELVAVLKSREGLDHDDVLEFCGAYELKDVCRRLELPSDGADAVELRKRIRRRLYLPASTEASPCPDQLGSTVQRRERRRARQERDFREHRRSLLIRYGFGSAAALFIVAALSPFQKLGGALLLIPFGLGAGTYIALRQPDHVTGSFVFGVSTVVGTLVGTVLGVADMDLYVWAAAALIGGFASLGAREAAEGAIVIPRTLPRLSERRPLLELIRMLPDARLNSLALELDVELPVEPGRDALLAEISRNARFDRHRVLRSLDEPELRRIAHRLELPEAIDDIDEDELRAVIARCFELTVDAR